MNKIEKCFLEVICRHICGRPGESNLNDLSGEEYELLFKLGEAHSVLPIIFDCVYDSKGFQELSKDIKEYIKRKTIANVMNQASHSTQFLELYRKILDAGLNCLVVKGIICRQMYPKPDYRCSNDEDLYISKDEFMTCHRILLEQGLTVVNEKELENADSIHVVSYVDVITGLHLELHQTLFEEDSKAYGYLNSYFKSVFDNTVSINVEGVPIKTFSYTDNILYLVCHAFKHFIMRGFGIRQLCDIIIFAEKYGVEINWMYVEDTLREIGADVFFANLLDIGQRYIGFSREKACIGEAFTDQIIDSEDLLEDLLDAGVFGKGDSSRLHSNSMTLDAMAHREEKCSTSKATIGALFPKLSVMKIRYHILDKLPWLLPVMWICRIGSFLLERGKGRKENSAVDTLNVGKKRVELLKKYNIIS